MAKKTISIEELQRVIAGWRNIAKDLETKIQTANYRNQQVSSAYMDGTRTACLTAALELDKLIQG